MNKALMTLGIIIFGVAVGIALIAFAITLAVNIAIVIMSYPAL